MKFKDRADNKEFYTDFRLLLERDDIDVVAIATPPGWHALISIAAMEAGKDVVCEKPMCRFISEGRAVAEAVRLLVDCEQVKFPNSATIGDFEFTIRNPKFCLLSSDL